MPGASFAEGAFGYIISDMKKLQIGEMPPLHSSPSVE
jgi:hypothetical protein